MTHDDLHSFILMEGEHPVDVLDLAGLQKAPGLYHDVTQSCRLVFTNQKRLVFTQVKTRVCSASTGYDMMREKMVCMYTAYIYVVYAARTRKGGYQMMATKMP